MAIDELKSVADATVVLYPPDGGQGSGVVIAHVGSNSFVLTCEHVIRGHKKCVVARRFGSKVRRFPGRVERIDEEHDLAIVRTNQRIPVEPITIAKDEPELYDRVYGVGNAGGLTGCGFEGVLTAKDGSGGCGPNYTYTGLAVGGMSGGPLADEDGDLVGIIEAVDRSGHLPVWSIGYAVPLPILKGFLGKSEARKFAKRAKK